MGAKAESWDALNHKAAETVPTMGQNTGQSTGRALLIFSAEASRDCAKTSASRGSAEDSQATDQDSSSSSPESLSLFDPSGFSSRTYPGCSPRTAVGTSESCLERWPTSGMAWDGGFSTAVSSECRSAAGECSSSETSLADVLEPSVPQRFYLSARAAKGILRRAEKRGRELPPALAKALQALASRHPDNDKRTTKTSSAPRTAPDEERPSPSPEASGGGNDGAGRRSEDDPNLVISRERERVVNAIDRMAGGPDDNSAQAGHLIAEQ